MIIVVHNECHFYSNVLDYLNNFIIITISQDNYFRPPPPLIEKCFLDDVSDILLPCSCYQTTMRSGRECASREQGERGEGRHWIAYLKVQNIWWKTDSASAHILQGDPFQQQINPTLSQRGFTLDVLLFGQ